MERTEIGGCQDVHMKVWFCCMAKVHARDTESSFLYLHYLREKETQIAVFWLAEHACLDGLEPGHFLFVIHTGTSQGSECTWDTQYLPFLNHCPRYCGLSLACACHDVLISFIVLLPRIWMFWKTNAHMCKHTHAHENKTYNCLPEIRVNILDILVHRVR